LLHYNVGWFFFPFFWWWFPTKPSQFLSSPWVWPINSRCYHDFPGQGPTPWAAPWGCHGAGGREVMGPQVDGFLQDVHCLVRIVYGFVWK
jgi:hypothetical protein